MRSVCEVTCGVCEVMCGVCGYLTVYCYLGVDNAVEGSSALTVNTFNTHKLWLYL